MRWTLVSDGTNVNSTSGVFRELPGGTVVGNVSTTLNKSKAAPGTFYFTETVRIPRNVLLSAKQQNARQIRYERTFTDNNGGGATLVLAYTLTGSSAGTFGIANYSLRFNDGSVATIVQQQQPLKAVARIGISGVGLLKGVWEVATPGSTSGTAFYSSLQMVSRQVSSGQPLRLESPPLPTNIIGNHMVRFRVLSPGLSEDAPAIQYFVGPKSTVAPHPVDVLAPPPDSTIDSQSRFEWHPVINAASYKIEIVNDRPASPSEPAVPVTGILVKAANTNAGLTPSLMKNLRPDTDYWWHVLAFDRNGQMIAASPWQRVHTR